ncbi:MAG: NUDIX hydrolase [Deltaproteobacteria bacterium]|nr:NUDIX hydrolase [Deltaproteobacteria bacterium]
MGSGLRVLGSQILCKGPKFYVLREELELPGGKGTKQRDSVMHPGAAVFAPQLADGRLVLVRQYRYAMKAQVLEFPAGTLDSNEDPLACAQREIQEEVGLRAEEWLPLGTSIPAPGICNEVQHFYLARNLSDSRLAGDEDEDIEVVKMSVREVEAALTAGEIQDGKTMALFLRARLRGLL